MSAYGEAALLYLAAGWTSPLPLPHRKKWPPPDDFTGHQGKEPTGSQVERWIETRGDGELCVRLPKDTIGIDIDAYKGGTLEALVAELGPLPDTYYSTSRTDGSGIYLYAIPVGVQLRDKPVPCVEIVQFHHRYVIAWPSKHELSGATYRWIEQASGEVLTSLPEHDDIPALPQAWIDYLQKPATASTNSKPANAGEIAGFIERNTDNNRPQQLDLLKAELTDDCARHPTLCDLAVRAMNESAEGSYPAQAALDCLSEWWQRRMNTPQDRHRASTDITERNEFSELIGIGVASAGVNELLYSIPATELPTSTSNQDDSPGRPFGLMTAGEIGAEVDAMPPAQWLWRRVWPADGYGVVSASWKVGKTFMQIDAAISAASGTPWLSLFEAQRTGTVVVFAGEGGKRKLTRRGRAVAAHYGVDWDTLPIYLAERVPKMGDAHQVELLAKVVAELQPVLVIIDPLYLAVGGDADSTKLAQMGDRLEPAQRACQDSDAALMLVHHNKRDKSAKGSEAMSGAGPAEWGRVLITAELKAKTVDIETQRSDAHIALTLEGDELAGGEYRFRRRVWVDDPDSLGSPMHYVVEPIANEVGVTSDGLRISQRRVLDALTALGDWRNKHEIGDYLANDGQGSPLRQRTILEACAELVGLSRIEAHQDGAGTARSWRITQEDDLCNLI